jgi:hypothetical protein
LLSYFTIILNIIKMKKTMKKLFNGALFLVLFLVFVACNSSSSQKGKWDAEEKKVAKEKFVEAIKQKMAEGGQPLDDNVVNDVADCWVNKLEAEFANLSDANDNATKRGELSDSCFKEILMPTDGGGSTQPEGQTSGDSTQTAQ